MFSSYIYLRAALEQSFNLFDDAADCSGMEWCVSEVSD
jgi:hypothetical protein